MAFHLVPNFANGAFSILNASTSASVFIKHESFRTFFECLANATAKLGIEIFSLRADLSERANAFASLVIPQKVVQTIYDFFANARARRVVVDEVVRAFGIDGAFAFAFVGDESRSSWAISCRQNANAIATPATAASRVKLKSWRAKFVTKLRRAFASERIQKWIFFRAGVVAVAEAPVVLVRNIVWTDVCAIERRRFA